VKFYIHCTIFFFSSEGQPELRRAYGQLPGQPEQPPCARPWSRYQCFIRPKVHFAESSFNSLHFFSSWQ